MLKRFAVLLLCGFLALNIKGQNFGGGFTLGLSSSQVGGDNLAGFHKAGLLIGIFANKNISEYLSYQMEMIYTQKGSNNPKMNDSSHPNYLIPDIIEIPPRALVSAILVITKSLALALEYAELLSVPIPIRSNV